MALQTSSGAFGIASTGLSCKPCLGYFCFRRLRSAVAIGFLIGVARLCAKGKLFRRHVLGWLACEVSWAVVMRKIIIPNRIRALRVDDAGSCDPASFDRTVDIAEQVLRKDQRFFWRRIARIPSAHRIPRATVQSYAKSLLYVNPDTHLTDSKQQLVEHAVDRLESASGAKFKASESGEDLLHDGTGRRRKRRPSTVSGWTDDAVLTDSVRSTPLAVCVFAEISVLMTSAVLAAAGWKPGNTHGESGMEVWRYQPRDQKSHTTPVVLFPGMAAGYTSFLPLALLLQAKLKKRTLILFRWPWAEIGMPMEAMPQWNSIVQGIFVSLNDFGADSIDLIAHSYGTCVANRAVRRLCGLDADAGLPAPAGGFSNVHSLILLEPMTFGDTSAGLSCGFCNEVGMDINLASLANRGGVPWKESMFYNPSSYGQCQHGMSIYACDGDILMDVNSTQKFCEKYQPNARFVKDATPFTFHGRFLCELWLGGYLWHAPCSTRVLSLILDLLDTKLITS